jgi:predicted RND superfamily exporter protein
VLLLVVLVGGGFLYGGLSKLRVETGIGTFLPSSDPSVQQFNELSQAFGGDAIVVLLRNDTPKQLLNKDQLPKLLDVEGQLSRLPDTAATYGPVSTLNQVAGQAQNLLAEITGRRQGLRTAAEDQARQRGEPAAEVKRAGDTAISDFDRRYGPLIVQGLPSGLPTLRNPQFVNSVIYNGAGEPRPQWRYVVPDSHSAAVLVRPRANLDQAGTSRLVGAVRDITARANLPATQVTVSGVPALVGALGDEVGHEVPVVGSLAIIAIGLCLICVPWTSRRRRLLPLLVTGLATGVTLAVLGWVNHPVSLGVIAFLPVLAGLGSYYPTYFARRANLRTVFVVAGGTVASFLTLGFSPLPFVRDLGVTLALGIAFSVTIGWYVVGRRSDSAVRTGPTAALAPAPSAPKRRRVGALVTMGLVAALGWSLLPQVPLEANFQKLANGLPALAQANQTEQVVGSSAELGVTLQGDNVLTPRAWQWMQQAQQKIVANHGDEIHPVLSPPGLLSFLGDAPTGEQISSGVRLLPNYLTKAVLRDDSKTALMTYGVQLDDLQHVRGLTDQVRSELPPPPPGFRAELTGLPTVAVRGYDLVSAGRYLASLAGVVAAGLLLCLGLRNRTDGVRAVVAAGLATGVELLGLWLTDTALDPLTVALGSLTAAVGCEFTVMTCESKRARDPGLLRAVGLATLTSAAGYGALCASNLSVMQQFGILLAVSVILSYLSARFVVWAWPVDEGGADSPSSDGECHSYTLMGVR